jgi:hypothetical protein
MDAEYAVQYLCAMEFVRRYKRLVGLFAGAVPDDFDVLVCTSYGL